MSSGQYCDECGKSWTICDCRQTKEKQMTNKEQLLNKLAEMQCSIADLQKNISEAQKQAEELQKQINEPEKPNALLERVEAGVGNSYYTVTGYNSVAYNQSNTDKEETYKGNSFTTQEQAENYRKAFETFLELRRCTGTVKVKNNVEQYTIGLEYDLSICTRSYRGLDSKGECLSPCFSTGTAALNAIETVGEENILHMFKTFHGLT